MKILVLATDYPKLDGTIASYFIHSRNKLYIKQGIDVSVLSFASENDYIIEGINVYTLKSYQNELKDIKYDVVLSHAPNVRNHYNFLKTYGDKFNNIIFYFHGHEVLRTSQIYPESYEFTKNQRISKKLVREIYDAFKLMVWKNSIPRIVEKSRFIFVSNWMYDMFIRFVKINPEIIKDKNHIIYNCIGKDFESITYNTENKKEYDFITIRGNLDGAKYGIDIVTRIAKSNPQYKFCVVGKGEFYKHFKKPDNLEWIDKNLTHEEIVEYLNKSRSALLPTRADAQGVMACEMATFGIPLITSEIDVCKEVFAGFKNVALINNDDENIDIESIFEGLQNINVKEKNEKYFAKNTIGKEIVLFESLLNK